MSDFSRPCGQCERNRHGECQGGTCGCIVFHADDTQAERGFKRIKQEACPERDAWTEGGFAAGMPG
jgi:hypothetical protein